ncbi:unnamed protein product [Brassicogethes aeneus]|uniref:Uncharacterized protein n=1 Tax=Brassicogethes aeneus TaxID=1431903 RepID=A0A9P0BJ73_BRAAE|nr:unnamed protein product [Brassicogethes aeneus]
MLNLCTLVFCAAIFVNISHVYAGECEIFNRRTECCTKGLKRNICVNFTITDIEKHELKAVLEFDNKTISNKITKSYSFNMCIPRTKICLKYNEIEKNTTFWCMMVYNKYNEYEVYYHLPCLKENGEEFYQKPNFYIHNNFLWDIIAPEMFDEKGNVKNDTILKDSVSFFEGSATDVQNPTLTTILYTTTDINLNNNIDDSTALGLNGNASTFNKFFTNFLLFSITFLLIL